MMPPRHSSAVTHLRQSDPVLGNWIDQVGKCGWQANKSGTHFDAIARSVIYQQLSGAAAGTIHARFTDFFGAGGPTPARVLKTSMSDLRSVGLSTRKGEYLLDLAGRVVNGSLPVDKLDKFSDQEVIDCLTEVRGIGEWTAQMFLMFRLGRPDVLPVLDLGIRKGVQILYRMRALPSTERLEKLGRKWAPYRTVASWYLWRRVDNSEDW